MKYFEVRDGIDGIDVLVSNLKRELKRVKAKYEKDEFLDGDSISYELLDVLIAKAAMKTIKDMYNHK